MHAGAESKGGGSEVDEEGIEYSTQERKGGRPEEGRKAAAFPRSRSCEQWHAPQRSVQNQKQSKGRKLLAASWGTPFGPGRLLRLARLPLSLSLSLSLPVRRSSSSSFLAASKTKSSVRDRQSPLLRRSCHKCGELGEVARAVQVHDDEPP